MVSFVKRNWKTILHVIDIIVRLLHLRKDARERALKYIRDLVKKKLKRQIIIVSSQIIILIILHIMIYLVSNSLVVRLVASIILWGIILYNLTHLVLHTIPELFAIRKKLRSSPGYESYICG